VLARSFLELHRHGTVTALVIDGWERSRGEDSFRVVLPTDLDLDPTEFLRMAMMYDPLELSCAMKAWVIALELDAGADAVIYLDSDVEVFDALDESRALALEHGIVLTPHVTETPPRPPISLEEEARLEGGTFNAGFLAVGSSGTRFLDWWRQRLARECINEPAAGYFVDQRWLNFVPGYFDHHVVRDPGWNVGSWNLLTRRVEAVGSRITVDGAPLRFLHFGGFDAEVPYLVSRWLRPKPTIRLSSEPLLAGLYRSYARKLYKAGYELARRTPYGYGSLSDGTPIAPETRRRYRTALLHAEAEGGTEPPNPFTSGVGCFRDWLAGT
jgi:hypothetical protein